MPQKKKLQVFVSSTYSDLKGERQAAVEAILTAGHIPAGMELFAAGDESQMNAIKRWIDESDVFLLILGGRYGSIEPKSQKSYIQLEYEYASERGKALFAVVIDDTHLEEKVKREGSIVIERENPQKLNELRSLVLTKMVRFWSEPRDIKLAILETMAEFSRRDELVGWIPGDEGVRAGALTQEIARLAKENSDLRQQLARIATASEDAKYSGLTFEEMKSVLVGEARDEGRIATSLRARMMEDLPAPGAEDRPNMLQIFWAICLDWVNLSFISHDALVSLMRIGLLDEPGPSRYDLSDSGRRFYLRLRVYVEANRKR